MDLSACTETADKARLAAGELRRLPLPKAQLANLEQSAGSRKNIGLNRDQEPAREMVRASCPNRQKEANLRNAQLRTQYSEKPQNATPTRFPDRR